jgi:hypothetical protein
MSIGKNGAIFQSMRLSEGQDEPPDHLIFSGQEDRERG